MKKSFIFHIDSLIILDRMSDEQAGQFIKIAYYFMQNGELPECEFAMEMAITPFVNQWIRDNEKWDNVRNKRIIAGAKGGKQKVANASKSKKVPYVSVNVNANVNGSVNANVNKNNNIPTLQEVKSYFAEKGYREDVAERAYEFYNVADWHDSKGKKVKNWKQKMQSVWFKDENKLQVKKQLITEQNPELNEW